jgi:hypothetical protein
MKTAQVVSIITWSWFEWFQLGEVFHYSRYVCSYETSFVTRILYMDLVYNVACYMFAQNTAG